MRYIGEEVPLKPDYLLSKFYWITCETTDNKKYPSFWFEYKGHMYYGIVQYEMSSFEQMEDWEITNDWLYKSGCTRHFMEYEPTNFEHQYLMDFKVPINKVVDAGKPCKTIYYKLDYTKATSQEDMGEWTRYELNFLKIWYRKYKLNKILEVKPIHH